MEYGNLATLVTGLEFVNGKGEVSKYYFSLGNCVKINFLHQLVSAGVGHNLNVFKAALVSGYKYEIFNANTLSKNRVNKTTNIKLLEATSRSKQTKHFKFIMHRTQAVFNGVLYFIWCYVYIYTGECWDARYYN